MASVYAATHSSGTPAAVKVLHPVFARSPDARDRFMREGYIANAAGPGAVRILDDDIDEDGAPYLVMELLTGEEVDARMDRMGGRLPLREVLWLTSEALATLVFAHANGILHRDLKPANLFWTSDDRIKLLDFGLARLRLEGDKHTSAGTILGTLGYMAPEAARGDPDGMDARTDVWSVGAIMFRLLTGESVHPEDGLAQRLNAARNVAARSVGYVEPSLPPEVVAIVDRALAFVPDDRYPSALAKREAIQRLTGTDDLRPRRAPPPPPPPMKRVPSRAALAAVKVPDRHEVSIHELAPEDIIREPSVAELSADDLVADEPTAEAPPAPAPAPAPAPPPPPAPAPEPGLATGMSDEDTLALRALLELLEMATLTRTELEARDRPRFREAAKLGAFRRLEAAHKHATLALGNAHIGLFWNVLPEGFATRQGLLWLAKPPLPNVPERMHADGVRMLGLLPGVELEELGEVVRALRGEIAPFRDFAAFFHASHLPHVVHRIDATKPGVADHPALSIERSFSGNVDVLATIDAAVAERDPARRASLFTRLERVATGHEREIVARLASAAADPEAAIGLLRVLAATGTPAASEALVEATASPSPLVQIEALALLDPTGERLRKGLDERLDRALPETRLSLLAAIREYRVKGAAPLLATRVQSEAFARLAPEEQRETRAVLEALQSSPDA
jgi:serine/threonine-protein kinase